VLAQIEKANAKGMQTKALPFTVGGKKKR